MPNNEHEPVKPPAGPWDVALYLVQRFPIYAVAFIFIAAALYGANIVLQDRDAAQQKLEQARQTIETERRAAAASIAEALKKADDKTAIADAREREAFQKEAKAEANALLKVQDTLLTASERVQRLVVGQITSMEQLEDIRQTTATALEAQIADLTARRAELQKGLDEAQRKSDVATVDFALENLDRQIKTPTYSYDSELQTLLAAFTGTDTAAINELEARLSAGQSPELQASIQYALAANTHDPKWSVALAETISGNVAALSESWFRSVFACCKDLPEGLWDATRPAVSILILSSDASLAVRLTAAETFFSTRPGGFLPILADKRFASDAATWGVLAFLIEVIRGDHPEVTGDERGDALSTLLRLDLSAAHVWIDRIASAAGAPQDEKDRALGLAKSYGQSWPVLADPPAEELVSFWTRTDLATRHDDHNSLDLGAYERPNQTSAD